MIRTTLLILCLTAALFAGCTGNKKTILSDASLLAYWSESDTALRCEEGLDCVEVHDDLDDFEQAVIDRQNGNPRMELVRLEAHDSGSGDTFVGVWQESSEQHDYALEPTSQQFQDAHQTHSTDRHRLVYFTVWKDVSDYRIAAIWRHPTAVEESAEIWQPDVVQLDLSWDQVDAGMSGHYLDDIEVYPSAIAGDPSSSAGTPPFIAAVWRPGTLLTKVLHGDPCPISKKPLEAQNGTGNRKPTCSITDTSTSSQTSEDPCPVLARIAQESNASPVLRPSDFEIYAQNGKDHLAVLLQQRTNKDWLMVPGSWGAVDCRHRLIEDFTEPLGLLDLDLVSLGEQTFFGSTHEGVIHDNGTSGPPP